MADAHPSPDSPAVYEIQVKGYLPAYWSHWFDDMVIAHRDQDSTVLTGPVVDQAALYGLLERIRDLGLSLLAVRCLNTENPSQSIPSNEISLDY